MMIRMPPGIGGLVERHFPMRRRLAWSLLAGMSLLPALVFYVPSLLVGGGAPWWVFAGVALVLLVAFGTAFSEWWLLEYRFHERALVVGSAWPLTRTVVIPYFTIAPETIRVQPRYRPTKGSMEIAAASMRTSPHCSTEITFSGLLPGLARRFARRDPKLTPDAISAMLRATIRPGPRGTWRLVVRDDGAAVADLLQRLVRADAALPPW